MSKYHEDKKVFMLDARMLSLWHAIRYPGFSKPVLGIVGQLILSSVLLGILAVASYSNFDANVAFPGRWSGFCAGSTWHCPSLFGWQAPWWFWLRTLQAIPFLLLADFVTIWAFNRKKWKIGWWSFVFFHFASGGVVTLIGELLIMTGLPTRLGGWIVLLDSLLLVFILSLAFWNQDLIENFGGLEKMSKRITGVGIGILAVLGVAVGRMFAANGETILLTIAGIIVTPWIIVLSGKEWTKTLWRLSPWRVEAKLRQMSAKRENNNEH